MSIYIDPNLCTGCGVCVNTCPNQALSLFAGKAVVDINTCDSCELCEPVCPENAISFIPDSVAVVEQGTGSITHTDHDKNITEKKISITGLIGSFLIFMTQKLTPVVLDSILDRLDHRSTQSNVKKSTIEATKQNSGNRQKRYRRRYGQK